MVQSLNVVGGDLRERFKIDEPLALLELGMMSSTIVSTYPLSIIILSCLFHSCIEFILLSSFFQSCLSLLRHHATMSQLNSSLKKEVFNSEKNLKDALLIADSISRQLESEIKKLK